MPTLKIVAACEKTIFDQDGPVSLISLFQRMNIQLQDAPLPERAISPTLWTIFTLWETDPKEFGQEFTQVVKIFAPDGTLFAENVGTFKNSDVEDSQIKIKIQLGALPIWSEGTVIIRVWLKDNETELGSYRFTIRYVHPPDHAPIVEPVIQ